MENRDRTSRKAVRNPSVSDKPGRRKKRSKYEFERLIRHRRRKRAIWIGATLLLSVVLVLFISLQRVLGYAKSYREIWRQERAFGGNVRYVRCGDGMLEYGNSGMTMYSGQGLTLWTADFMTGNPGVQVNGSRGILFDRSGNTVIPFEYGKIGKEFKSSRVNLAARIASNGSFGLLSSDEHDSYIDIYDANGAKVAEMKSSLTDTGVPTDFDFNEGLNTMVISYLRVDGGGHASKVEFYDMTLTGEDKPVLASFSYPNEIVTRVRFHGLKTAVAVGKDTLHRFEIGKEAVDDFTMKLSGTVQKVFVRDFGIVTVDKDGAGTVLTIYDFALHKRLHKRIKEVYNDICVCGDHVVFLDGERVVGYRLNGFRAFDVRFDEPVRAIEQLPDDEWVVVSGTRAVKVRWK